jgi:hypothetical protein
MWWRQWGARTLTLHLMIRKLFMKHPSNLTLKVHKSSNTCCSLNYVSNFKYLSRIPTRWWVVVNCTVAETVTPICINHLRKWSVPGGCLVLVAFYCLFKNGRPRIYARHLQSSSSTNCATLKTCSFISLSVTRWHSPTAVWIILYINLQTPCKSVSKHVMRKKLNSYTLYLATAWA